MRIIRKLVLLFLIFVFTFISQSFAENIKSKDGLWEYFIKSNGITLCEYFGNEVNVEIPSTVDGYTVVRVDAFLGNENVESVKIPGTVKQLGIAMGGFMGCSNLKSVEIEEGDLKTLGAFEFSGCTSLISVKLPSTLKNISGYAFARCTSLENITIPSGIEFISCEAFCKCINLRNITVNNSNYVLDNGVLYDKDKTRIAFYPLTKEDKEYTVPNTVKNLEQYNFENSYLEKLNLGDGVESINITALNLLNNLKEINVVNNPNFSSKDGVLYNKEGTKIVFYPSGKLDSNYIIDVNVKEIEVGAMDGCENLTKILVMGELTNIGESAFPEDVTIYYFDNKNNQYLEEYIEQNNLNSCKIGNDASKFCQNYVYKVNENNTSCEIIDYLGTEENIVIPEKLDEYIVTNIALGAFNGNEKIKTITFNKYIKETSYENASNVFVCSNLERIIVDSDNPYFCDDDGILFNKDKTNLICFPCNKEVQNGEYTVPNYVTKISMKCFYGNNTLIKINIDGDHANRLNMNSFQVCSKLEELNVTNNSLYKTVDGVLFSKDGTSLLLYPSGKKDKEYVIPESVTDVYGPIYNQFLEEAVVSKNVTLLDGYSFAYCNNLKKIEFNCPQLQYIKPYTCYACTSLEEIEFCEGIKGILNYASFAHCESLKEVTIPNSIEYIGDDCFRSCKNLEKITIENPECQIYQDKALADCEKLVIYCKENSKAKQYAIDHNIKYEIIESEALENTTWQEDYKYSLDEENKLITLNKYIGSNTDITVPSKAVIDGKEYNVTLKVSVKRTDVGYTSDSIWKDTKVKSIVFEEGVTFPNDCSYMFARCSNLTKLDLKNIETCNVTNMSWMFYSCYDLINLDLSNFDTRNVIDMSYMFDSCYDLINLDLSNFDTRNVIHMTGMFMYCRSLTSLDVSNFDTENVRWMMGMFIHCDSLTNLDISNFDMRNLIDAHEMFFDNTSLTTIKVPKNIPENIKIELPFDDFYELKEDGTLGEITYSYLPTQLDKKITLKRQSGNSEGLFVNIKNYKTTNDNSIQYIENIMPKTSILQVKQNIETNGIIAIYSNGNKIDTESSIIKTGDKLVITKDSEKKEYTIVVKGDCNGTGDADFKDILKINRHRLNKQKLEGAYLKAGDTTGDGKADFKDILRVNKFRLGKIKEL